VVSSFLIENSLGRYGSEFNVFLFFQNLLYIGALSFEKSSINTISCHNLGRYKIELHKYLIFEDNPKLYSSSE
jgi:hypothetical protein